MVIHKAGLTWSRCSSVKMLEIDGAHLHQRNGFHAAAHRDVGAVGHDLLCRHGDGIKARGAIAIDGDTAVETGQPAQMALSRAMLLPVGAFRKTAADSDKIF